MVHPDFEYFKYFTPRRTARMFMNYYISNESNPEKIKDLEELADSFSKLGIEKIKKVYAIMEKELNYNVGLENYFMAHQIQQVMKFYEKNVVNKSEGESDNKKNQNL